MPISRSIALALSTLALLSGLLLTLLSISHVINSQDTARKIVAQAATIEDLNKKGDEVIKQMAEDITKHPGTFTKNAKYEEIIRQLDEQRVEMQRLLDAYKGQPQTPSPYIGVATAIVGALGTIFTILFSWRADRRNSREACLKIVQMQQQITELERKLKASADDGQNKNSLIIQP